MDVCCVLQATSSLEFVKKDLGEFTSTMQNDTTKVADQVKSKINVSIFK